MKRYLWSYVALSLALVAYLFASDAKEERDFMARCRKTVPECQQEWRSWRPDPDRTAP